MAVKMAAPSPNLPQRGGFPCLGLSPLGETEGGCHFLPRSFCIRLLIKLGHHPFELLVGVILRVFLHVEEQFLIV